MKKTKQQRLKVLLAVWPRMAEGHRPEFQAYLTEKYLHVTAMAYREHYIWPYVNQEDLGGPKSLLILLNARARHPPPKFAGADLGAMHFGILHGVIKPVAFKDSDYAMVLHGVTRSADYGRMQALKTSDDYSTWVESGKQFLPSHGLLVLEAQEKLMVFLVHFCLQILHDIPEDTLTTNFPIIAEPQLQADPDDTAFKALSAIASAAPYRVPGEIDFDCMESLLAAKVAAIEDHIWSLREDPRYFVEQLLDTKDHRIEMIEDIHGRPGPLCRRGNENQLWKAVQSSVILLPLFELDLFGGLHQQVKVLRALRTKNSDNISPGKSLPEGYLMALLNFRGALLCSATAIIFYFGRTMAPAMRKYFVRIPVSGGPCEDDAEARVKPGVKTTDPEGRLFEMFDMLSKMSDDLDAVSLPLAVDELDRLIQAEPRARALMSTKIASLITDLSIMTQCLGQLSLYQPWASCFERDAMERSNTLDMGYTARRMAILQITMSFYHRITTQIVELGTPTGERFTYPAKKRRTKETVTAMRLAERNLDAFWAATDCVFYSSGEVIRGTRAGKLLAQPRVLQRTPRWVEPDVSAKGNTLVTGADMLVQPFSELFSKMSEKSRETENTPVREKVKTRGTQQRSNDDATPEPTESPKKEPQLPSPPRPLRSTPGLLRSSGPCSSTLR